MELNTIRTIGEIYRQVTDLAPRSFVKGHEHKAAQRPLIHLNRAIEIVERTTTVPHAVADIIRSVSMILPTEAVSEILYEEQQSAFLLGFNSRRPIKEPIKGVKAIRKSRGLSQEDLAELSGVARSSISNYERGLSKPSGTRLVKLSNALRCMIDDLLG